MIEQPSGARAALGDLRTRIAERLVVEGEGGALLAALALGWREGVSAETRDAFRRLGLSHLLAVSGLHLGLLAAAAFGGARRIGLRLGIADPRRTAVPVALALAAVYVVLTGASVSVVRAATMLGFASVALVVRRPVDPWPIFAAAALAVLASDPSALFAPGAQLSFAATAALLVARVRAPDREGGLPRALGGLSAAATAILATGPLAAWHFGVLGGLGWLANLVAVPLTALVLLPAALGLAAAAWIGAFDAVGGPLWCAWLTDGLDALGPLARASVGGTPRPAGSLEIFAGAFVGVVVIASRRPRWILAAAGSLSIATSFMPPPRWGPAPPRVVFFDVGQGDATVVDDAGAALLVDAGARVPGRFDAGERIVVPALAALGIERLSLAVATHRDLDHRGGLPAVLGAVPTKRLWLPPRASGDPAFDVLRERAASLGVRVEEVAAGRMLRLGRLCVSVLWPPAVGAPRGNDGSIVLRITGAGRDLLLAGDLEARGEAALIASGAPLGAEILKLPHHGSRTSSTSPFLERVRPVDAVVSAALRSRWGMPHPEVLARLDARGIAWHWPARDGAVAFGLGAPERGASNGRVAPVADEGRSCRG